MCSVAQTQGQESVGYAELSPLVDAGLDASAVLPGDLSSLTALGDDDWLHVAMPLDGVEGGIEALSDVLPHLMAPLSLTLLPPESPEVDWDEQWLGLEACLELCGSSAGLVMVDELTVRHVCGDEDVDVDEVAADWAAVHGLALIVVGGADRASAVKPDGRVEFVTVDADRTLTGMNGSVGFLSGYLTDPSDLPRALQRMSVV